jgi:hypothetical protein
MNGIAASPNPQPPEKADPALWRAYMIELQRSEISDTTSPSRARGKLYGRVASEIRRRHPGVHPTALIGPEPEAPNPTEAK